MSDPINLKSNLPDLQTSSEPGEFCWRLIQAWLSYEHNTFKKLRDLVEADPVFDDLNRVASINAKAYGRSKATKSDAISIAYHIFSSWHNFDEVQSYADAIADISNEAQEGLDQKQLAHQLAYELVARLFDGYEGKKFSIEPKKFHNSNQFFENAGKSSVGIIIPTPSEMILGFDGWKLIGQIRTSMSLFFRSGAFGDRNNNRQELPTYIWLINLKRPPKSNPDEHFYGPFYSFMLHVTALLAWGAIEKGRDRTTKSGAFDKWRKDIAGNCIFFVKNLPYPFDNLSMNTLKKLEVSAVDRSKFEFFDEVLSDLEDGWELIPEKISDDLLPELNSDDWDNKRTQLVVTIEEAYRKHAISGSEHNIEGVEARYWISSYKKINEHSLPDIVETPASPNDVLDTAYRSLYLSANYLLDKSNGDQELSKFLTQKLSEIGWMPLKVTDVINAFDIATKHDQNT